jgi:hypothetical protein
MTNYRITEVETNGGKKWYELEMLNGSEWKFIRENGRWGFDWERRFNSLRSAKKYADNEIAQRVKSRKIVYP